MRIGIDLMGSESSPTVLFEAVLNAAQHFSDHDSFVIFTTPSVLQILLDNSRFKPMMVDQSSSIDIHLVSEDISMEDDPLAAVRIKKDSSIVQGIFQLKEKKIDAFVSAGNTGALVASASIQLPKMGLDRCCLLASLPTKKDPIAILDVGGFLSPSPETLLQYGKVGAAYQRALLGKKRPNVGLMNIGVESKKGTSDVRLAHQLLSKEESDDFHFVGNVEGRESFQGGIDVLVTDGFTGNVLLKVSQGVSAFIFDDLKSSINRNSDEHAYEVIDHLHRYFRYDEHPGAFLCGVDGLVIKCHGAASTRSMYQSIVGAKRLHNAQVITKMGRKLNPSE